jgi:hypothetical protein
MWNYVICVNCYEGYDKLTLGKKYCIYGCIDTSGGYSSDGVYYLVKEDNDYYRFHYYTKFISLKEYRKKKLEKLNEK